MKVTLPADESHNMRLKSLNTTQGIWQGDSQAIYSNLEPWLAQNFAELGGLVELD